MDLAKSDPGRGTQEELHRLRRENAHLKALLVQHGIPWQDFLASASLPKIKELTSIPTSLTTDDKIVLFRRLFRGREDVYAQRWESQKGKSGYTPACGNEWKPGVCHKC